jgi:GTP cyclohydrolase II
VSVANEGTLAEQREARASEWSALLGHRTLMRRMARSMMATMLPVRFHQACATSQFLATETCTLGPAERTWVKRVPNDGAERQSQ